MNNEIEILRKFSERQKNGKLKYYIEYKCVCGKINISRRDGNIKSCGCLNWKLNPTRKTNKRILSTEQRTQKALRKAQDNTYKLYSDGDLSFHDFISLSQMNCFYCNRTPSNKYNLALKQDGTIKLATRINKDGQKYRSPIWCRDVGEAATFIYNGLDRIDQSLPHNKSNVVTCCKNCNMMKRNMNQESFISHVKRIAKCLNLI